MQAPRAAEVEIGGAWLSWNWQSTNDARASPPTATAPPRLLTDDSEKVAPLTFNTAAPSVYTAPPSYPASAVISVPE